MTTDRFLSRWMRRKTASRLGEALPPEPPVVAATPQAPAAQALQQPVQQELPTIDSLRGLSSDYQAFMQPSVDKDVKGAALKQLFADPHFHFDQMDGLDIYIDDYGKPDPIPAAMLAALSHARGVLGIPDPDESELDTSEPSAANLNAADPNATEHSPESAPVIEHADATSMAVPVEAAQQPISLEPEADAPAVPALKSSEPISKPA